MALEGIPVSEWRYDLAARSAGPKPSGGASARVISPAPDFIMAAAGRDRFEALASSGILSIEGDQDLAWTFLSRIRIV